MTRTKYEIGYIVRRWGDKFLAEHKVVSQVHKTLNYIAVCRTSALGGHVEECPECGEIHVSYNSCRDRHCPKCQQKEREQWTLARKEELIPAKYFHVVFTVPDCLHPIAMSNQRIFYNCLFKSAWNTLKIFACNKNIQIGMTSVLHTWGSNLFYHPHLHCIVPGGGIGNDGHWHVLHSCKDSKYLFPVQALSKVFRAKFMTLLTGALKDMKICIPQDIRKKVFDKDWCVHSKPPVKTPNLVVEYLARYAFRVAISNSRIKNVTNDGTITYDYKDYKAGGKHKLMSLDAIKFIHLFSLHIVPQGFTRIRHYGFLAPSNREKLCAIQQELSVLPVPKERKKNHTS